MKKILVIGFSYQVGGVETSYMNYYRKLDKKKYEIDFLSTFDKLAFENEIIDNGSHIIKITYFKKNPFKYYKDLKKVLKINKYDVVHINMLSAANVLPIKACKKCKIKKIIVHSHNAGQPKGILKKILHALNRKYVCRNANYLLACSNIAGNWLFGNKKFAVINNAIDLSKFKYNVTVRNELRNKLHIKNNDILIGHVGRFYEQKNHEHLIKIFKELHKLNPNYKLILIGDGPLKNDIKKLVNDYKINNSVIFSGAINNVNDYYSAMDVFVLPSLFEGLPMVLIEAQTAGLDCYVADTVTKESKVCDNLYFFSLNNNCKTVASLIDNTKGKINRNEDFKIMKNSKYNIEKEYISLTKFYD